MSIRCEINVKSISKQPQIEFFGHKTSIRHRFKIVRTLATRMGIVFCYGRPLKSHVAHVDFVFYLVSTTLAQKKNPRKSSKIGKMFFSGANSCQSKWRVRECGQGVSGMHKGRE